MQGGREIRRGFKGVRILLKRFGNGGVGDYVRIGNGRGGAKHAEFKFVARESEGGGAVAVRGILWEARQHMYADLHLHLLFCVVRCIRLNRVQHALELFAQKHGKDGRRRFICAKAVIVAADATEMRSRS